VSLALIVAKDLRLLLRDRVALVFMTVAPIVVIIVAGFSLAILYGYDPTGQTAYDLPIVDEDGMGLGVLTVWDVMRHLGEIFDEIESAPRLVDPASDISSVTWVDTGGGG